MDISLLRMDLLQHNLKVSNVKFLIHSICSVNSPTVTIIHYIVKPFTSVGNDVKIRLISTSNHSTSEYFHKEITNEIFQLFC